MLNHCHLPGPLFRTEPSCRLEPAGGGTLQCQARLSGKWPVRAALLANGRARCRFSFMGSGQVLRQGVVLLSLVKPWPMSVPFESVCCRWPYQCATEQPWLHTVAK